MKKTLKEHSLYYQGAFSIYATFGAVLPLAYYLLTKIDKNLINKIEFYLIMPWIILLGMFLFPKYFSKPK